MWTTNYISIQESKFLSSPSSHRSGRPVEVPGDRRDPPGGQDLQLPPRPQQLRQLCHLSVYWHQVSSALCSSSTSFPVVLNSILGCLSLQIRMIYLEIFQKSLDLIWCKGTITPNPSLWSCHHHYLFCPGSKQLCWACLDHVNARYPAPVPAQGPAPHLTGLTHRQPTSHLGKHHHTTCAYRSHHHQPTSSYPQQHTQKFGSPAAERLLIRRIILENQKRWRHKCLKWPEDNHKKHNHHLGR